MTDRPRYTDNELIDELTQDPAPSQGNASGGDLARAIGQSFISRDVEEHEVAALLAES